MPKALATIIIPNYNGMNYLPRLLESLAAQTDDRLTIAVVDDCSTDDSTSYIRDHHPHVNLIINEQNQGFAASCNTGMKAATTPIVALLNNDTHVAPDWFAEAMKPFDDPAVTAVASLVLLAEPPHLIDSAGDVYSVAGGALKRNHLQPRETALTLPTRVFSACGASAFYRRAAVERVGWLDEEFVSYYEDVDLAFRLAWAGGRCVVAPRSVCYHHLSASYSPTGWTYHFNSARNAEWVWRTNLSPAMRRKFRWKHAAFLLLQGIHDLTRGQFRPWLVGKWSAYRRKEVIARRRAAWQEFATATDADIMAQLEQDWWKLHVSPRLPWNKQE